MSFDNILLGDVEIPSLDNITDLGIEVSKTWKLSLRIQTKIVKARRSFNYLKHSVPFKLNSVPSEVKFNLFKACVLSVLYGYPAWFPEISDIRRLEQLNILGLLWCFGYNDYSPAKIFQLCQFAINLSSMTYVSLRQS